MDIEQSGVEEMKAKMLAMRQHMSGPGSQKAVRAGGNVIKGAMVERTPVLIEKNAGSNALEPGSVKRDILVRFPASENQYQVTALIGPGKRAGRVAHLVEYGHRMVVGGKSRVLANGKVQGNGKVLERDVPAHPFLRPAFEASVAEAQKVLAETMGKQLQEAVK